MKRQVPSYFDINDCTKRQCLSNHFTPPIISDPWQLDFVKKRQMLISFFNRSGGHKVCLLMGPIGCGKSRVIREAGAESGCKLKQLDAVKCASFAQFRRDVSGMLVPKSTLMAFNSYDSADSKEEAIWIFNLDKVSWVKTTKPNEWTLLWTTLTKANKKKTMVVLEMTFPGEEKVNSPKDNGDILKIYIERPSLSTLEDLLLKMKPLKWAAKACAERSDGDIRKAVKQFNFLTTSSLSDNINLQRTPETPITKKAANATLRSDPELWLRSVLTPISRNEEQRTELINRLSLYCTMASDLGGHDARLVGVSADVNRRVATDLLFRWTVDCLKCSQMLSVPNEGDFKVSSGFHTLQRYRVNTRRLADQIRCQSMLLHTGEKVIDHLTPESVIHTYLCPSIAKYLISQVSENSNVTPKRSDLLLRESLIRLGTCEIGFVLQCHVPESVRVKCASKYAHLKKRIADMADSLSIY